MNQKQWDELKRLHEAATRGEWFATDWERPQDTFTPMMVACKEFQGDDLIESRICECEYGESPIADAEYIAAIHNAFPAILAERSAAQNALRNCLLATGRKADRDTALAEAVRRFCKDAGVEPQILRAAAFDKETQNEG